MATKKKKLTIKKIHSSLLAKLQTPDIVIYFATLSLLIFAPLLFNRGYILSFDMVFSPDMRPGEAFNLINIHRFVLYILAQLFPAYLIQKIILISIIIFAGVNSFNLAKKLFKNDLAAIISATLFAINPFVYERLLAGHWLFLVGFAILPLLVNTAITVFFEEVTESNFLKLILIWAIVCLLSPHYAILFGIIFLVFSLRRLIIEIITFKDPAKISKVSALSMLINLVGIISILIINTKSGFDYSQVEYFAPSASHQMGLIYNLLTFNGFWAQESLFQNIFEISPLVSYIWCALLLINFSGIIFYLILKLANLINFLRFKFSGNKFKPYNLKFDHEVLPFIVVFMIMGFALSLGPNSFIADIYKYLTDNIHILNIIREPQKFASLYILGFTIFLGFSLQLINLALDKLSSLTKLKKSLNLKTQQIIATCILVLVFLSSLPIFNAASGQLNSVSFPQEFKEVNNLLDRKDRTLVLPWKGYANFPWMESRLANPANRYFKGEIIQQSDIFKNTDCDIQARVKEIKERKLSYEICINNEDDPEIFYNNLKILGFTHVIVLETNLVENNSLLSSTSFKLIYNSEVIKLYELK